MALGLSAYNCFPTLLNEAMAFHPSHMPSSPGVSISPGQHPARRPQLSSTTRLSALIRRRDDDQAEAVLDRRSALVTAQVGLAALVLPLLSIGGPALAVTRSALAGDVPRGAPALEYIARIQNGYLALKELLDKWGTVAAKGDGDAVRRYLGTVGTYSPLFQINRAFEGVLQALSKGDDSLGDVDVLEYGESYNLVLEGLRQTDYLAYSNNFAMAVGDTKDYLEESRLQAERTLRQYREVLRILNVPVPTAVVK
ncbi:unnamed protein product [Vitrella brassicaformis CCMP3155]|uniref:Uncharacterized protein n=1 Tax=Vitrella brassicaformis (strain CCMP3155) TaxID=1169540 RepID=A0A0G4H676_VITBC|nr:unnamed protein product [Vitrella brassicaformis CCMP3155]|eukprot:CEM39206.1 unnamed protein product [Vitrella brassicaformis CCMP3155]